MLECLPPPESAAFSPVQHGLIENRTAPPGPPPPPPMAASSPETTTISLSHAYDAAVLQTNSFKEMVRITSSMDFLAVVDHDQSHSGMLAQVLDPDRECVLDALQRSKSTSTSLFNLNSSYFQYSEETTSLCLTLRIIVAKARRLYCPIDTLLCEIPIDSLSPSHCDLVFQEFRKFNAEPNPFPRPDSHTFDGIRDHFSDLRRQLDRRLRKSSSRIHLVRPPAAEPNSICCGGGAAITAYIPPRFVKRELAYAAQLKVATRNTYILKTDLDTLDSLVSRLHNTVEDDKRSIQTGLNMGNDQHTVQELLKQWGKDHQNMGHYLDLLEQKITTCFNTINRSRSQLLEKILLHQTSSGSSHHSQ
ncbi:UPF0496 protein At3g19330 [Cucurbita pepo subsp. pepo]|uniref:UPF0496 protein At3g19330 n=1 Tax=Cucurbita pepo subsp. pepo TaxID=3664 RepID=UPI000C9D9C19|nr:UPF0496 protein At3g19330 [Cucurbita pepo subsp. pepo]